MQIRRKNKAKISNTQHMNKAKLYWIFGPSQRVREGKIIPEHSIDGDTIPTYNNSARMPKKGTTKTLVKAASRNQCFGG